MALLTESLRFGNLTGKARQATMVQQVAEATLYHKIADDRRDGSCNVVDLHLWPRRNIKTDEDDVTTCGPRFIKSSSYH